VFEKLGARLYLPLPVSAAFHSRYMGSAARAYADYLSPMSFASPKITVIANVTAQPYPSSSSSESVKSLLTRQIDHSVQWIQSVRFLIGEGVSQFVEMGPGNVLTKSIQEIRKDMDSLSLTTAANLT
jgi:malonyl CoA-acyl carrier protein transacylase